MTCIIGMYYDNGSGALIIADSRTMIGGDYSRARKIFTVEDDEDDNSSIVFAAAGYSGIIEKLLPRVRSTRARSRQFLPGEIVDIFEDEMAALYERYKMNRPYRFDPDDTLLNGIIGFLDDGVPSLYCLFERGYAEILRDFRTIGHGARHAHNILRTLYDPGISHKLALQIGVHALVEVSKVDAMVDDCPQIAILEQQDGGRGLRILNQVGTSTDFAIECDETRTIKEQLSGIEEKRTKVFHLLLDGDADNNQQLEELLREYQEERSGQAGEDQIPERT